MARRRRARVWRGTTGVLVAALVVVGPVASPVAARDTVEITLLATNDLHVQLEPPSQRHPGLGGAAYLASHLEAVRDRAPHTLYVDAGDLTGAGSGISPRFGDEPTVDVMNAMGLDVATVGNHEFDHGIAALLRNRNGGCLDGDCAYRHDVPYEGAQFETLSANVTWDTGQEIFPGWTIRHVAGVAIGLVGVTALTEDPGYYDPHLAHEPTTAAVAGAVDEVVAAGADIVVVLWHDGSQQHDQDDLELISDDPDACVDMGGPSWWFRNQFPSEVDVVIDGHRHRPYVCDQPGTPLLTQATDRGSMFTEITLTYDAVAGEVVDRSADNHDVTHDVAPDAGVEAIIEHYTNLAKGRVPPSADLDGDDLGDAYEVFTAGTDPRVMDTDGDGLTDGWEVHRTCDLQDVVDTCNFDPTLADTDGGGADDGVEAAAYTDPANSLDDWLATMIAG